MSRQQSAGVEADIEAIVTFYDPSEHLLFVQDKTGGIFINATHDFPLAVNDRVSVQGNIKYGYRAGIAENANILVLAHDQAMQPVPVTYRELATGRFDSRLVRVSGVIQDAVVEHHPESQTDPLHLDIKLESGVAEVYVYAHPGLDPRTLLGKKVQLTGVAGGAFNANQQMTGVVLYCQSLQSFIVKSQEEQPWSTLPLADPDGIFSAVRTLNMSPRLRLRGAVVYFSPGESAYLEQDGKSFFVQTRQTGGVTVGNVVDTYGFPDSHGYVPSLRDAILNGTTEYRQLRPMPLTYEEAISGKFADHFISIEGKVLSQLQSSEASSITLDVQGHVVRGSIQNGTAVPAFALGSRVQMAGICQIATGGPWREPVRFSILARSASDLKLLQGPSWWNTRHFAELLGLFLGIAMLVIAWALWLYRRVVRQANRIRSSMLIENRRSAVIKRISQNPSFDVMLKEICDLAQELLPGAECRFDLEGSQPAVKEGSINPVFRCDVSYEGSEAKQFYIFMAQEPVFHHQEVFTVVRELLMLAVNNAELHQKLVHRSTHDSLTDLPNRRLCEQRFNLLLSHAAEDHQTFSVLYVDVDRFKQVNDEYGHKIGDSYLQAIAKRFLSELRQECTLARIGGDEFLVLLPHSDQASSLNTLQRLKHRLELPFSFGSIAFKGSASFGSATYPIHGQTKEELEQHADQAMYSVKKMGKAEPVF